MKEEQTNQKILDHFSIFQEEENVFWSGKHITGIILHPMESIIFENLYHKQEEIELESVEEEHPITTKSEIHIYDGDEQVAADMQCTDCHRVKTKKKTQKQQNMIACL